MRSGYHKGVMLKIRLQRVGRRNNPSYRVIVIDSRAAAKKGRPVELLGTYDTLRKQVDLKKERINHWVSVGAQVSDTVHNILLTNGVIEGVKRNTLPKKQPIPKNEDDAGENQQTEQQSASEEKKVSPEDLSESVTVEEKDTPPKDTNPSEGG